MDMQLQKALLCADLTPTEKLVGMVIAYHIHRKRKLSRVRQDTIAKECGVSIPTVKRAVSALRRERFIDIQTTGRASFYRAIVKDLCYVEGSPMIPQKDQQRSITRGKPWELDTVFSTTAEEKYKRLLEENGNGRHTADAD